MKMTSLLFLVISMVSAAICANGEDAAPLGPLQQGHHLQVSLGRHYRGALHSDDGRHSRIRLVALKTVEKKKRSQVNACILS